MDAFMLERVKLIIETQIMQHQYINNAVKEVAIRNLRGNNLQVLQDLDAVASRVFQYYASPGQPIDVIFNFQDMKNWMSNYINQAEAALVRQQQQQQMPGVNFSQPGVSAVSSHLTGGGGNITPAAATQQVQQPVYAQTVVEEPKKVVAPVSLKFAKDTNHRFEDLSRDSIRLDRHLVADTADQRYTLSVFEHKIAANNPKESYRELAPRISQDYRRGLWTHCVNYTQLIHVPMGTKKFIELTDEAAEALGQSNNWRIANDLIEKCNKQDWTILSNAIVRHLNMHLTLRLRTNEHRGRVALDTLDELHKIDHRSSRLLIADHSSYAAMSDLFITNSFEAILKRDYLVQPEDKHFGDFVRCENVIFYKDGYSKFDYGCFKDPTEARDFREKIIGDHTVLRVPARYLVTNIPLTDSLEMHPALAETLRADSKIAQDTYDTLLVVDNDQVVSDKRVVSTLDQIYFVIN